MKIGILTFHAVPNYGAVLQAYALQKYLEQLGHDVRFIDYRPPYLTTGGHYHWPRSQWHIKANIVITYQKLMTAKGWFSPAMRDQHRRFAKFTDDYLKLWPVRYRTIEELRANPPDLNVYICGSDQIWNPSQQYGLDPACFFDFGPDAIRRISYAASFGASTIPERHHRELAQYSAKLDAVSIREESGRKIFENLTGRSSELVADPTFLVNWGDSNIPSDLDCAKGKLFSYVLRSGDGLYQLQKTLGESLRLGVIQPLNPHQRWKCFGEVMPMSPLDWLAAIRSSAAVITNSFHGTVFAILFNKPFLSVKLSSGKEGLNARASHLLKTVGLSHRQVARGENANAVELMREPIDWAGVNQKIEQMKAQGNSFLQGALM